MGQSTDAYVAFGFDLGDGEEIEWPEGLAGIDDNGDPDAWPDLDGFVARRAGLIEPTHERYKDPEWGDYFTAKREAEQAFRVDLVQHCSGEYPMWIFALRRTVQRATRGSPEPLSVLAATADELQTMKTLCEEMGLPWQEPSWLLFSNWN